MDGASPDIVAAGELDEAVPLLMRQPFMGELQQPLLPQKFVLCRCKSRLEPLDFDEMLGLHYLSQPFPGRPFHFGFGVLGGHGFDNAPEYMVEAGDYLALRLVTIARKIKKQKIDELVADAVKDAQKDGQKMIAADVNILEAKLVSLALKKAPPSFRDVMLVYHRPSGLMMVAASSLMQASRLCKMLDKVMHEWHASPIVCGPDASAVVHAWTTGGCVPPRTRLAPPSAKASPNAKPKTKTKPKPKTDSPVAEDAEASPGDLAVPAAVFEFDSGLKMSVTPEGVFCVASMGLRSTKAVDRSRGETLLTQADTVMPSALHLLQLLGTRVPLQVQPHDYWDDWSEAQA